MRYFILLFCLFAVFPAYAMDLVINGKIQYDVDVPQTLEEKAKGLMFVDNLPSNKGMLFDLRGYKTKSMWMKNTYIPLDMIFIDCDFEIVDVYENAEPLSLKLIGSDKECCYVLEVNGGDAQKKGIKAGDKALFSLPD